MSSPRMTHIVLLTEVSNENPVRPEDIVMKVGQIGSWGWPFLGHDFVLYGMQCIATTSVI